MYKTYTNILIALLCCGFIVIAGCKKTQETDTRITNRTDKVITLDIYSAETDYSTNSNLKMRKTLQPNEVLVLTNGELELNKTYFADWYDDTRYHNNWFNSGDPNLFASFRPVHGSSTYYINPDFKGLAPAVFLKTTGTQTTWRVGNIYQGNKYTGYASVLDQLPTYQTYREIVINKNFTASHSYKKADGNIVTETLNFVVHNASQAYIEFKNTDQSSAGYMQSGNLPTGTPPEYESASQDTVMALLPYSDYTFMMVRD